MALKADAARVEIVVDGALLDENAAQPGKQRFAGGGIAFFEGVCQQILI
jgi:hypothetical protein